MSKRLVCLIVAAVGLAIAACTAAPKNYGATDPQMSGRSDPHYCKTHSDILECRQNTNPY
jgi:hypothetical protein